MVDVNKLLGSILNSGAAGGFAGGLAGSLAGKKLTGKSAKKMGSSALKLGGIAAIGALAYSAYKNYNQNQGQAPQQGQGFDPSGTPPQPATPVELSPAPADSAYLPAEDDRVANDALGLTLVRAMIAVARADGRLDARESQLIFQRIESLGLDSESQNLLVQEMGHPVDIDAIVNSASSPEIAAEIYVASSLAAVNQTSAERSYLAMLAARLQLPPQLVSELEHQVQAIRP